MKFKHRVSRLTICLLLGFVALFVLRLGYGYLVVPPGGQVRPTAPVDSRFLDSAGASKKNYASDVYQYKSGKTDVVDLNQKYEKTASIRTSSSKFTEDEKKVRDTIATHNAIIQFENGKGNEGSRVLYLTIGVQPALFDIFYQDIKKIGVVQSIDVTKTDKTNEFLSLKAQKLSLETTRASLIDLKKQSGKIEEFVNLQNRILSIEQQLQRLGVQLGEFDEVNAFCTVKLAMAEQRLVQTSGPGLVHRVQVAFFWAAKLYVGGIIALLATSVCAFMLLVVIDKFNLIRRLQSKLDQ